MTNFGQLCHTVSNCNTIPLPKIGHVLCIIIIIGIIIISILCKDYF